MVERYGREGTRQISIRFPTTLLNEMEGLLAEGERSNFVVEATARELRKLRMKRALEKAFGAWQAEDHPEFKDSSAVALWVSTTRKEHEAMSNRASKGRDASGPEG